MPMCLPLLWRRVHMGVNSDWTIMANMPLELLPNQIQGMDRQLRLAMPPGLLKGDFESRPNDHITAVIKRSYRRYGAPFLP